MIHGYDEILNRAAYFGEMPPRLSDSEREEIIAIIREMRKASFTCRIAHTLFCGKRVYDLLVRKMSWTNIDLGLPEPERLPISPIEYIKFRGKPLVMLPWLTGWSLMPDADLKSIMSHYPGSEKQP